MRENTFAGQSAHITCENGASGCQFRAERTFFAYKKPAMRRILRMTGDWRRDVQAFRVPATLSHRAMYSSFSGA